MGGRTVTYLLLGAGLIGFFGIELLWPVTLDNFEGPRTLVQGLFGALAGVGIGRLPFSRERG